MTGLRFTTHMTEEDDAQPEGFSLPEFLTLIGKWPPFMAVVAFLSRGRDKFDEIFGSSLGPYFDVVGERLARFRVAVFSTVYSVILRAPALVIVCLLLMTYPFFLQSMEFQHQINGDVEVYLPDGANSTDLLLEVREQWSTDIVLLYVHTDNAIADANKRGTENVTDQDILRQISWIEGDDENQGAGGLKRGLDYAKDDRGTEDGVVWILSHSQIIKEANSSAKRFNCALEKYQIPNPDPEGCPITSTTPSDGYSIPSDQDTIDRYVENAAPIMRNFVRDTQDPDPTVDEDGDGITDNEGDGIWDTAVIVIGIRFDMNGTEIDGRVDPKDPNSGNRIYDHRAFIEHTKNLLDKCEFEPEMDLCRTSYNDALSSMNVSRQDILPRDAITVTGLTPVLHDVSDAVYDELVERMLPLSIAFVALAMIILHRSPKVVVICGMPIILSLMITFGSTVFLDIMLTPMIISAGPILVGLGVDYALHLVNRIEENRNEMLDEHAQLMFEAEREGKPIDPIDPWDEGLYHQATVNAACTTGNAIMLSALTTIIGFNVLTWTSLVPIKPMRTVGTTLLLGIAITFFLSMVMVPALSYVLRYRKGRSAANDSVWSFIGTIPVRAPAAIIVVTLLFSAYGAMILSDELGKDITGSSDEVPPGLQSYEALAEYSRVFNGGQTNMFIVDAEDRGRVNDTAPIRDLPILDAIDRIQTQDIDTVDNTTSISLVTILKSIPVTVQDPITETVIFDDTLWGLLHSDCWDNPTSGIECPFLLLTDRETMVNVVFDTLSPEVRSMLMNADGGFGETKTLVYVNQPYINLGDAGELRKLIDQRLTGSGCEEGSALNCNAVDIEGVDNTLLTGSLPVSLDINAGIHEAQSETTLATMMVLLVVMAFLFMSPRLAVFTMTAVGVVVLWQPLLMRGGSVNVNVFTAMIGTIVFGIGVDDSIHIVDRIKDEGETPGGISKSVEKTGQTIFETTATTSAGLAAGLFVSIPGLQNFFVLMMLLIILALLTSSLLLPSMIVSYRSLLHRLAGNEGTWAGFEVDVVIEEQVDGLEASLVDG